MIDSETALQIAAGEIGQGPTAFDPLFAPWQRATLGQPVLVADVRKQPSYWLVPIELGGRAIGFARVLGNGQLGAMGALYRDPSQLDASPSVVTGLRAAEAASQAASRIDPAQGEVALEPVYVHDGPAGREAWLVEVEKDGQPQRWIFVSPGGLYERPAGTQLEEGYE